MYVGGSGGGVQGEWLGRNGYDVLKVVDKEFVSYVG